MSASRTAVETALTHAAAATERAAVVSREAPVDLAVQVALAEAGAASVDVGERAIADRVGRGLLGWDDVWRDPQALGPEGVRLVQRALVLAAREIGREAP
ncbi:hypothetical protein [Nocardioides sp. W7]|uniref:hypothetical protein n=1 Tax=Nocardioides sp. W7 TaxID=2931390 RepID=UPI001FD054A6|nr:hypothetical protein [Nocardioides sp. W7]